MENGTIHLNLTRNWFDYIFKGIGVNTKDYKKQEYRKITAYFCQKFLLWNNEKQSREFWQIVLDYMTLSEKFGLGQISFINPDTFTFSNGMTPPVPRFEIENKGIEINTGIKRWGATEGIYYFVLNLGEIIKK